MGRGIAWISIALVALMIPTIGAVGTVSAVSLPNDRPVADLEGQPIVVSEISDWFCHDLDYPQIHCFRTAASLDRALSVQRNAAALGVAGALAALPYVVVYRDSSLQGAYFAISQSYDNLSSIGWNDAVSSFRAVNGLYGHFATDALNAGRLYPTFCCNLQVPYVGDSWNDQFSSVYPW